MYVTTTLVMIPHINKTGDTTHEADNACAPSMMDDRSANSGTVQYAVMYSNFTLDDKLLNLMGKMNNAVPLILNPIHLKGKMLCHIGHLI
jgi:hypothetical protein